MTKFSELARLRRENALLRDALKAVLEQQYEIHDAVHWATEQAENALDALESTRKKHK